MTTPAQRDLEFRIAISPTVGFFVQIRFFEAALRRLGGVYRDAMLTIVVGNNCDIDAIIAANAWSKDRPVRWVRVPDEIFNKYGIHGNADWRYFPDPVGKIIILGDADTVLVRDVNPALEAVSGDGPAVAGHMAHMPPPITAAAFPSSTDAAFWPRLFDEFGAAFPERLFPYSMDAERRFPLAPPYFNLGFLAMNAKALEIFRAEIFAFEEEFMRKVDSYMRCQVACTVIPFKHGMNVTVLSAEFNAANDLGHYHANGLTPERIRVIHYLRHDELDRSKIFMPGYFEQFLNARFSNPVNSLLQEVVREVFGLPVSA